jgi:hypothetical protein
VVVVVFGFESRVLCLLVLSHAAVMRAVLVRWANYSGLSLLKKHSDNYVDVPYLRV